MDNRHSVLVATSQHNARILPYIHPEPSLHNPPPDAYRSSDPNLAFVLLAAVCLLRPVLLDVYGGVGRLPRVYAVGGGYDRQFCFIDD